MSKFNVLDRRAVDSGDTFEYAFADETDGIALDVGNVIEAKVSFSLSTSSSSEASHSSSSLSISSSPTCLISPET